MERELLVEAGVAVGTALGRRCWSGTWLGEPVAARVHLGVWPTSRERAALLSLADPALPRVRAVVLLGAGTVVISDFVDGAQFRGPARQAGALVGALERLHALDLRTGGPAPGDLRCGQHGQPMLTGVRCPSLVEPAGAATGPAADCAGLAALLAALPGADPALQAALRLVLGAPVVSVGALAAVFTPSAPSRRPRWASRRALAGAAALVVLAGVLLAAAGLARPRGAGSGHWANVVAAVDAARAAAFEGLAPLSAADLAGSAAYRADEATLAVLAARREQPLGLRDQVHAAWLRAQLGSEVVLAVRDGLAGYQVRSPNGWQLVAAARPRDWLLTLRAVGAGWRLVSALPAPASG